MWPNLTRNRMQFQNVQTQRWALVWYQTPTDDWKLWVSEGSPTLWLFYLLLENIWDVFWSVYKVSILTQGLKDSDTIFDCMIQFSLIRPWEHLIWKSRQINDDAEKVCNGWWKKGHVRADGCSSVRGNSLLQMCVFVCSVKWPFEIFIGLFLSMQISPSARPLTQTHTLHRWSPDWEFKVSCMNPQTGECDYTLLRLWLDTLTLCLTPICLSVFSVLPPS